LPSEKGDYYSGQAQTMAINFFRSKHLRMTVPGGGHNVAGNATATVGLETELLDSQLFLCLKGGVAIIRYVSRR
jgi:hypothetical protein